MMKRSKEDRKTCKNRRPQKWEPMKYPKFAIYHPNTFFPLHSDVLSAALRELLILDGYIDSKSLKVLHTEEAIRRFRISTIETTTTATIKSDCCRQKRKYEDFLATYTTTIEESSDVQQLSGEMITREIVLSVLANNIQDPNTNSSDITTEKNSRPHRRPRLVSEADQTSYNSVSSNAAANKENFTNHQLTETLSDKFDFLANDTSTDDQQNMTTITVSIANETKLRDIAIQMTLKLVSYFSDTSLRMFFGYKPSIKTSISHEQLTICLALFLFDVSHAMYGFEQTFTDFVASRNHDEGGSIGANDLKGRVLQFLFNDERSLNKIGGLDMSSILPQAISLSCLRHRGISWAYYATTGQGMKMLEHHKNEKSQLLAGKARRGKRLHHADLIISEKVFEPLEKLAPLTSIQEETVPGSTVRSSLIPAPVTSLEYQNLLNRIPLSKGISIFKHEGGGSWGVGLVKERGVCVVGKVPDSSPLNAKDRNRLSCGDLILYAENEKHQFAFSPLVCSVWMEKEIGIELDRQRDWYRSIVDLFKNSHELHLIIQRVA